MAFRGDRRGQGIQVCEKRHVPTFSQSISHSPYTLPSSVSRKSCTYNSYSPGVSYQQFPIWNSPGSHVLRAPRFSSLFCSPSPRNLCVLNVSVLSFSFPLQTLNL